VELLWWFIVIVLFAVGLIGTVVPVLPGTVIILAAAVAHRLMVADGRSVGWGVIAVLVVLTLISYGIDFFSGFLGAKYFGASRWGTFGAILGALVGLFFGIIGLFVGPIVGALAGELIAGKRLVDAGRAGWGSLLGNLGGMLGKLAIGVIMITIFLVNVPSPI
jgi:uncharacterized protein YqgC (DUF456 family)